MRETKDNPHEYEFTPAEHEDLLLDTLITLEVPFLTAIKQEYHEKRGWKVCGASCIALGWLLNLYTGIPFKKEIGVLHESIRLMVEIKRQHKFDHAYLRYYMGSHEVIAIDVTAQLFWNDQARFSQAIELDMGTLDTLREILEKEHDLYTFTDEAADAIGLNILLGDGTPNDPANYPDLITAMHSPEALLGEVLLPSGRVHSVPDWGEPICRVIRATIAACPELEPVVEDWPVAKYIWPTDS